MPPELDEVEGPDELIEGDLDELADDDDLIAEDGLAIADDEDDDVEIAVVEEDDEVAAVVPEPAAKTAKTGATGEESDEDEEEEPDDEDVEASLDTILKERLVVEEPEDDEDTPEPEDRTADGVERVLPKQPGEFVCRSCFSGQAPQPAGGPEEDALPRLRVTGARPWLNPSDHRPEERGLNEKLLDAFVFVPAGLALSVVEELPRPGRPGPGAPRGAGVVGPCRRPVRGEGRPPRTRAAGRAGGSAGPACRSSR